MFHEDRDVIAQLKQDDARFAKVFERHNALDEEIASLAKDLGDQFEIESKKKEKLKLKDEIYNMIIKYKKDNNL
ncbi:YdcH family protein [Halarcobacter anaerophilus]|jgi:hypothetical protein|uniref:DUF465 domain-containing protein n=1 Tax=Halarcobacter anaerophilus TaxID=877500 RepID=A0A4Q0Y3I6_9BACT|nr:DUF465 domain-containing protein [Halarcobacter anaerophilus]QDF29497.1 DUF465 domain-containing protein [Halarcobacter anaerophilus]RXJ64736.1 DUF465 domain-containing protein [Halarcobacter anaerophilus]